MRFPLLSAYLPFKTSVKLKPFLAQANGKVVFNCPYIYRRALPPNLAGTALALVPAYTHGGFAQLASPDLAKVQKRKEKPKILVKRVLKPNLLVLFFGLLGELPMSFEVGQFEDGGAVEAARLELGGVHGPTAGSRDIDEFAVVVLLGQRIVDFGFIF